VDLGSAPLLLSNQEQVQDNVGSPDSFGIGAGGFSSTFAGHLVSWGMVLQDTNGTAVTSDSLVVAPMLSDWDLQLSLRLVFRTADNTTFIGQSFGTITAVEIAQTSVPIPAALPLFATGLVGLGLLGWRRKRKGSSPPAAV
jgi:hypothetical protein